MKVEVNGKEYTVKVARTLEEKYLGLQGVTELPEDEGMLFIYEEPKTIGFTLEDTDIALDVVFINEDEEVISVFHGKPKSTAIAEEDNVKYVLEVNPKSGIEAGDEVDIDDEEDLTTMLILDHRGKVQGECESGCRIVSRKETKGLIKKSKKAAKTKSDSDYKALGKYMFKILDGLDSREPQYTSVPE